MHALARVVAAAILSVGIAAQPGPKGFTDAAARVSFDPPAG
jgi:hypothetical protein